MISVVKFPNFRIQVCRLSAEVIQLEMQLLKLSFQLYDLLIFGAQQGLIVGLHDFLPSF